MSKPQLVNDFDSILIYLIWTEVVPEHTPSPPSLEMVYHSATKKGGVETRCRVTSLFSHGNRQLVQPGENVTLYCNATESPFGKSLKFTWLKKVLPTTTTKWSFKRNFRPSKSNLIKPHFSTGKGTERGWRLEQGIPADKEKNAQPI